MGFMNSLKNAASGFVKSVRHKTFKIRAEELAESWEKLRRYGVEIEAETGHGAAWFIVEDVSAREVEVGILRKSRKKKITVKCRREAEPWEEYDEDDEDDEGGWFDYGNEEDTVERRQLTFWEGDKVKIRMTEASYERMIEREGRVVG